MTIKQLVAGGAVALLTASPAFAARHPGLPYRDTLFLRHTTRDSSYESALSRLAVRRTRSPQIEHFALRDIYDHENLRREALQIAHRYNVSIDTTLTVPEQRHVAHLRQLSGAAFNTAYVRDLRWINQAVRPALQREEDGIRNRQVQQYLEQAQDVDQSHESQLDHIRVDEINGHAAKVERAADAHL